MLRKRRGYETTTLRSLTIDPTHSHSTPTQPKREPTPANLPSFLALIFHPLSPVRESACTSWEHCMNRDPSIVSFTKVSAEVVAGVLGGFVDTLSWRSLVSFPVTYTRVPPGTAEERVCGLGEEEADHGAHPPAPPLTCSVIVIRTLPVDRHLDQFDPPDRSKEKPTGPSTPRWIIILGLSPIQFDKSGVWESLPRPRPRRR
jgi:hypothetical protein